MQGQTPTLNLHFSPHYCGLCTLKASANTGLSRGHSSAGGCATPGTATATHASDSSQRLATMHAVQGPLSAPARRASQHRCAQAPGLALLLHLLVLQLL